MSAEPAFFATLAGGSDNGDSSSVDSSESAGGSSESSGVDQASEGTAEQRQQGSSGPDSPGSAGAGPAAQGAAEAVTKQAEIDRNLQVALRESRAELKELRAELAQLKASIPQPKPAEQSPAEEPDFLADPKSYVDGVKGAIKKLEDDIKAKEKTEAEQAEQQKQAQETWSKVIEAEREFAQATPDYNDALAFVRSVRSEQIKYEIRETMDREATDQEVAQIIAAEEGRSAAALIAKGKNPSKVYYGYAKTYGYKPKAAATPPAQQRPDKEAVRTMGSGGGEAAVEHEEADPGVPSEFVAARREFTNQFKNRARKN